MARIRTNKNICLHCFGDLDSARVCMNCHHKADDTPSPPHHLPQRTVLGTQNRYLVGKALGEGGFGITYLAWDLQQGIKVAVKEYFPSGYVSRVQGNNQVIINSKQNQAASNRGLKRFVEEARALAKIKNLAGVVNVRDFFSANGTAYIVMEFLDGVSLKKYLQRKGGKLGVDELLTIMRPVMESLTQVHKLGLIHRDISPDNILITKFNEVKLIDFGAAKYSNPDGKSLSIVLKQGFAPPEQYDTHGEQGPWTDVYALGVTIYYALTGTLPPESIRVLMGKESIKPPSELGIAIDPGVEKALMKSLAVDRKKRFQDVQSMINGLYNPRAPRKTAQPAAAPAPTPTPKQTAVSRTITVTATRPSVITPSAQRAATPTPAQQKAAAQKAASATKATPAEKVTPAAKPTAAAKATPTVKATPAAQKETKPATPAAQKAATQKATATAKATPAAKATPTVKATPTAKAASTAQKEATPTPAQQKASTQKAAAQKATPAQQKATEIKSETAAKAPAKSAPVKSAATAKTEPTEEPAKPIPTTITKTGTKRSLFARLFKK